MARQVCVHYDQIIPCGPVAGFGCGNQFAEKLLSVGNSIDVDFQTDGLKCFSKKVSIVGIVFSAEEPLLRNTAAIRVVAQLQSTLRWLGSQYK